MPLRYIRNTECLGFARNLLACLVHANGAFIKFLCDDDTLLEPCISQQAQALDEWPSASLVINQRLLCDADDVLLPSRALNWVISSTSALINGTDLLACVADNAINLFGGISHALLRRSQVKSTCPRWCRKVTALPPAWTWRCTLPVAPRPFVQPGPGIEP